MRTAAQFGSNTPAPSIEVHLVPSGVLNNTSATLVRSEPCYDRSVVPPINFNALGASMMLAILSEFSEEARVQRRKKRLAEEKEKRIKNGNKRVKFTDYDAVIASPGSSKYKISFGVWLRILDYLLCESTLPFVPENDRAALINSKFAIPSGLGIYPNRIKRLELALQRDQTLSTNHFFSNHYRNDFESLPMLLDAALNADLAIVKAILKNATDEQRQKLLSTQYGTDKATTRLGHIDVERTGTPLQMALYGHDEEMAAAIKSHMDPAEFQRQWEAVFGPDYNTFLVRQQQEANKLCGKLDEAFGKASKTHVTNALHRVANTTPSVLQDTLNRFKDDVEQHVRENRVHNPYILQRLFGIYDSPTCNDWDKGYLLSQQAIGVAQKLSSPRWLQHWSQGIYCLAVNSEPARRSFDLRDSDPSVDIRSLDRLCVDSCIDMFGQRCSAVGAGVRPLVSLCAWFTKLMSSKNSEFSEHYAANARAVTDRRNSLV